MTALLAVLASTTMLAAPAQASSPAYSSKDYAFVRLVRSEAPSFKYVGAKLMIKSAKLTCDTLDSGLDESEAAWMMVDSGFTKRQAIVFISAAMVVYCPWHGDDIS
jgi:hypothetical protein